MQKLELFILTYNFSLVTQGNNLQNTQFSLKVKLCSMHKECTLLITLPGQLGYSLLIDPIFTHKELQVCWFYLNVLVLVRIKYLLRLLLSVSILFSIIGSHQFYFLHFLDPTPCTHEALRPLSSLFCQKYDHDMLATEILSPPET